MLGRVVLRKRNACIRDHLGRVKHAETKACRHQALEGSVDFGFSDQALLHLVKQLYILVTARQIGSCAHGER